ncbi:lipopolysaccharide biosynthesis protein [Metabacillus indicus]|uniref:lipopolysaccharide biosynthesis protein n=1 Tax=Metabacillus indicus TaxID=246786 RepID=UPI0039841D72
MNGSRTYKSFKNSTVAIAAQLLSILLSFITRTFFIKYLGVEFLGINGLFINILTILSLAELGVGTAIVYSMYKPIAEGNEIKIAALMNLYKKLYISIGLFIGLVGISIIPFLEIMVKGNTEVSNLERLYILYLANTVISYFFTFKRSIIIANQYGYLNKLNIILFSIIQNILQIFLLVLTSNIYLYLVTQILCTLLSNIFISIKANKMYPYLKKYKKAKVDNEEKREISKNIIAMMSHKLGSVVVSGTDNLLISAYVGIASVGLYSNYVLISNTLKAVTLQGIEAITASVGNLTAIGSKEHSYEIFKKVYFINFVTTFYSVVFLYVFINPFIIIWIGEKYLLSQQIVLMIVINFYVVQMRQPSIVYINSYGLFWKIKWKSLVEAVFNLFISLILVSVFNMGIFGILIGTLLSNMVTNVWWEPFVVFKYGFNKSILSYYKTYVVDSLICIITMITVDKVAGILIENLILNFTISSILVTLILMVVYGRREEFKFSLSLIKSILKTIFNKIAASKNKSQ